MDMKTNKKTNVSVVLSRMIQKEIEVYSDTLTPSRPLRRLFHRQGFVSPYRLAVGLR